MKYFAWLVCAGIVQLLAEEQSFRVYAGYYGVATMMGKECTVTAINPFKLDLSQGSK